MHKMIKLKPRLLDRSMLSLLEKRQLIRILRPSKKILKPKFSSGGVDTIYRAHPVHGTHKLICVRCNLHKILLNFHPENEEFIIINTTDMVFKPLYMVIGLHKYKVLQRKIRNKTISNRDFLLLRLRYNDGGLSIFTMLKETVHCEITDKTHGNAPIFFVTEPSKLRMHYLDPRDYSFVAQI